MQADHILRRQAILNQQQAIVGYHLQGAVPVTHQGALKILLEQLYTQPEGDTQAWHHGKVLFISVSIHACSDATALMPRQVLESPVLSLQFNADDAQHLSWAQQLKAQQFKLALTLPTDGMLDEAWLAVADYIEVPLGTDTVSCLALVQRGLQPQATSKWMVADVQQAADYLSLVAAGIPLVSGNFFTQHNLTAAKVTNPGFESVLHLLNLVSQEADNKTIEHGFKRDTTLSYKLLRYINSVGFGLSCEVQSLAHALTILGRQQLYRWLTLLMVTAGNNASCPALMKTSIVRGRFTELLGEPYFDKREKDNLFVVGVFSLLDVILNQPMHDVLDKLKLPEAIVEALTGQQGIYSPFLKVVQACEQTEKSDALLTAVEDLHLDVQHINRCHVQALAWAEQIID